MTKLTFKGLNKKGTDAIYSGARSPIRIKLANFDGKRAPETLDVDDAVLTAAVKEAKPKLSKEERAALRANAPKPTLAEKLARAKKRADALAAQLAAEQREEVTM